MPSLVILGGTGFLGRSLLAYLNAYSTLPVKVVTRRVSSDMHLYSNRVTWHMANLFSPDALDNILSSGDIVIHLIYIQEREVDNFKMMDSILDACCRHQVSRFIHCSSAVVVGGTKDEFINEKTECIPRTQYERIKFRLEQQVQLAVLRGLNVAILRPTAIIGLGSQNLMKLAYSLVHGNRLMNYLRASLFGKRKMHLVPVRNVCAALMYIVNQKEYSSNCIYSISSDDNPENNFLAVEKMLLDALGLKQRKIPILRLPLVILSLCLRLRGRSASDLRRVYETNFAPECSLLEAINEFGQFFITAAALHN